MLLRSLSLLAVVLTAPTAVGQALPVAPCTGPTQIAQTLWNAPAIGVGGGKNPALGQSFTVPCTGTLRALSFYVYLHPVTGPIDVTVYRGAGRSGPVLATTSVNVTSAGWKTVSLGAPVPVTDGEVYTFVLTVPSGQNTDLALYTSSANPYAGGREYHALFGPFIAFAEDDLMFRVDIDAAAVSAESGAARAEEFVLGVASPNPADTRATVTLTMARAQAVTVAAYDALGREVAVLLHGEAPAGGHTVEVNTSGWPAGVYVIRASTAGASVSSTRLVVAR
ncbi:MAG TPA: DUF4082 domain-containing protein [Rubricoccaceae bacterium]|jgi:hypothetical protein